MTKSKNKYKKFYVSYGSAFINKEVLVGNDIWIVRAILGSKFKKNHDHYKVLAEFVDNRHERLLHDFNKLESEFKRLNGKFDNLHSRSDINADILNGIHHKITDIEKSKSCGCSDCKHDIEQRKRELLSIHGALVKNTSKNIDNKTKYLSKIKVAYVENDGAFHAECPGCDHIIITASDPTYLKKYIIDEGCSCPHCGLLLDANSIETDESKYCNSI